MRSLIVTLSYAVKKNAKADLKGFVIFIDGDVKQIERLNRELKADNIALCTLSKDDKGVKEYEINLAAKTTVLLYQKRIVTGKIVDYHNADNRIEFAQQLDALAK